MIRARRLAVPMLALLVAIGATAPARRTMAQPERTPGSTPMMAPPPSGTTVGSTPAATPPPAATEAPIPPEPEPEGREADEDRARFFFLEAAAGYTWIDLGQFRNDNLNPDVVLISGSGVGTAVGAGLQVSFLTFGLRGEWSRFADFDLGTVALGLGFRLPVPIVQPFFRVGLGYGWVLNVDPTGTGDTFPTGVEGIQGLAADAGLGVDIEATDLLSIQLGFDASVLSLKRQASTIDNFGDLDFIPDQDGEAVGLQLSLLAGLNLRF